MSRSAGDLAEDVETARDLVTVVTNLLTRVPASTPMSRLGSSQNLGGSSSSGAGDFDESNNKGAVIDRWTDLTSGVVEGGCSEDVSKMVSDLTKLVEHVATLRDTLTATQHQLSALQQQQQQQHTSTGISPVGGGVNSEMLPGDGSNSRRRFFERRGVLKSPEPVRDGVSPGGSSVDLLAGRSGQGSSHSLGMEVQGGGILPPPPPPPRPVGAGTISPQPGNPGGGGLPALPSISPGSKSPRIPNISAPPPPPLGTIANVVPLPQHQQLPLKTNEKRASSSSSSTASPKSGNGKSLSSKALCKAPKEEALDGGLSAEDCRGFSLE